MLWVCGTCTCLYVKHTSYNIYIHRPTEKNNQHVDFPSGHPPEYYPRLSLFNYHRADGLWFTQANMADYTNGGWGWVSIAVHNRCSLEKRAQTCKSSATTHSHYHQSMVCLSVHQNISTCPWNTIEHIFDPTAYTRTILAYRMALRAIAMET